MRRRPLSLRRTVGSIGVLGIVAITGMMTVWATTGHNSGARHEGDLHALVMRKMTEVDAAREETEQLRNDVEQLRRNAGVPEDLTHQPGEIRARTYRGPGVTVRLTDAPIPDPIPESLSADDLVIHQQDIEAVFNALWSGGAEVLGIQGVEVRMNSTVACVGNVITINGRLFSPPYEISAIGNREQLRAALDNSEQVGIIRQYAAHFGLGYQVSSADDVTIAAQNESGGLSYATIRGDD